MIVGQRIGVRIPIYQLPYRLKVPRDFDSCQLREETREETSFPKIRSVHTYTTYAHLLIAPTFLSFDLPFEFLITVVSFLNERIYEIVSFREERE